MTNPPPLVTVLMPVYNCEKYLAQAIESILDQTYTNFEFIIADDCSTDSSWNIIQSYQRTDQRIKCFRNKQNLQHSKTRNKLYDVVDKRSKYLAMMDSDDVSTKNRLEEQVRFLEKTENKKVGIAGSHLCVIDENSNEIGKRAYKGKITKNTLLIKSPIAHPTAMIRAEIIESVGGYNEKFGAASDFDLWCRIFDCYEIKNIPKRLLRYRISKKQLKHTHLRATLRSTLKIQWIYFKKYGSLKLIAVMLFEMLLLAIPKSVTCYLFKKIALKR